MTAMPRSKAERSPQIRCSNKSVLPPEFYQYRPSLDRGPGPAAIVATVKTRPSQHARTRACQTSAPASPWRFAPNARATADETPPPMPPFDIICISMRTGNTSATPATGKNCLWYQATVSLNQLLAGPLLFLTGSEVYAQLPNNEQLRRRVVSSAELWHTQCFGEDP